MTNVECQFGPWLRRKLVERHLSLAQLCRQASCDYTYLWRIIHAETAKGRRYYRPSYALTQRIGEALGSPREAMAAAGYTELADIDDARVTDRLAKLEQDLAELRSRLSLDPRQATQPPDWAWARLPLLGHIQAGQVHEALQNPDEFSDTPRFVARDAQYSLRVRGDSMAPTLMEGDVVTVRAQPSADSGQVVLAAVGEEVTLKRYEVVDSVPILMADNPDWKPLPCGPRVRILGVVTGSYRPSDVLLRRPR